MLIRYFNEESNYLRCIYINEWLCVDLLKLTSILILLLLSLIVIISLRSFYLKNFLCNSLKNIKLIIEPIEPVNRLFDFFLSF